jgi:hypothetical protein
MAKNPNIQTNFTAADMLGAKKDTPKKKKSAPTPKVETPKYEPKTVKTASAPKIKAEPVVVESVSEAPAPAVEVVEDVASKTDGE